MKKIVLFSLMVCLGISDFAYAENCQVSLLFKPGNNNWNASSNEYLFKTQAEFAKATNSGWVYECDNSQCPDGTYVEMGANHVFEGRTVYDRAYYKCVAGGWSNDHWEKVSSVSGLTKCTKGYWMYSSSATDAEADEYLFDELDDYKNVKATNYAQVYECDISVCGNGTVVTMPKGHYFKGEEIQSQRTYKCVLSGTDDFWMDITDDCPDCNGGAAKTEPAKPETKMCKIQGKSVNLGECVEDLNCSSASETVASDTKTGNICKACCATNSKGDLVEKWLITKCPSGKTGVKFKDAEKNWTPSSIFENPVAYRVCEEKKKSCKELYAGYPERIKCCEAGKATKWTGSVSSGTCSCVDKSKEWKDGKCIKKSDATCEEMYKGNEVAIACCNNSDSSWNSDSKECVCNEENKEWKYDEKTKKGECVAKTAPVSPSTTCTETDCKITINQTIRCFNNGNYFNSTENYSVCKEDLDVLRLDCNGLKTRVNTCQNTDCIRDLLTRIDAFDELIKKVCKDSTNPVYVPDNYAKIAAAKQTVSSFFGSAESNKSVWKDAQGNFNTARLASDLTAGVVLGTVGGVVSGVVIKKKQIEKGFDALHCAVGGQTVADWGDTFNVGLRR